MPRWTPAQAREMARLGNIARWSRPRPPKPIPEPPPTALATYPDLSPDYASRRLLQVREQLDRVTSLLAKSTDALEVERYARALAALSSQEFALAGRPLPGSLRPTAAAARKSADYRSTLSAPVSPPRPDPPPSNPFRRAGQ